MSYYGYAFVNNWASVYIYKSKRKNAKIVKNFRVFHLISHDESRRISQDSLRLQFLEILEYLSYYTAPGNINLSVNCIENRNAVINGEKDAQEWWWTSGRLHFDEFTTAAHWLYFNLFCRVYPYCEIDFTEFEMDANYKYLENQWKEKAENGKTA